MRAYAIYTLFICLFAPAVLLYTAGTILAPILVIKILNGHFETTLLLLPLLGGGIGLFSVLALTTELAGKPILTNVTGYARAGLLVGIVSESAVYLYLKPEPSPSLTYWLPPIVGAVLLFTMSFTNTANKEKAGGRIN